MGETNGPEMNRKGLFSVAVAFGPDAKMWIFGFHFYDHANTQFHAARKAMRPPESPGDDVLIEDDFGQKAIFKTGTVHGVLFEDLKQTSQHQAERALNNAHTQNLANKLARMDQELARGIALAMPPSPAPGSVWRS